MALISGGQIRDCLRTLLERKKNVGKRVKSFFFSLLQDLGVFKLRFH